MKKVLIVSYYYPPLGGVGIVKVLGNTRYLPELGWQTTVLCVRPDKDNRTSSLSGIPAAKRIFAARLRFTALTIRVLAKLRLDARQGFLLPDNYIDWFLPAYRAGCSELRRQKYDMIYATVPPYTCGLVAACLSHRSGLPLVVDIRDPWLDRTQPGREHRTRLHRRLDFALERYVVQRARKLTFIYQIGLDQYTRRYPDRAKDMVIVRPAFDFAREGCPRASPLLGKVTLAYAGHVYPPYAALRRLAQLLSGILKQGLNLTLGLWGCDDIPIARRIIETEGIADHVVWGKLLSLSEIFTIERSVTANIILLDFKTVPTKLYELLAAGRKIIYLGPPVEEQRSLLARYSAHHLCLGHIGSEPTRADIHRLARFLIKPDDPVIVAEKMKLVRDELSAMAQTRKLAALFDEALPPGPS
jgi:glycosyltransferase involved in cell wall biosynthesis